MEICLPAPGHELPLISDGDGNLIEAFHRPFLCMAKVEPESLGPHLLWRIDGEEAGTGRVVMIDVRTPGEHVLEASVEKVCASTRITAAFQPAIQIGGGFSVRPGVETEKRDDEIIDLRKGAEGQEEGH